MPAALRQALLSDIPAMQRVRHAVRENRLVSLVIPAEAYREAIEDTGRGWVIEVDDEVVAFAVVNARTGNVWALFVDPAHERCGFGRRLLDTLVAWGWSVGLKRLHLSTAPGTRAEGFYEAAGWRRTGLTPDGEVAFELRRSDQTPAPPG
ncbi:MAG: GNAT family N-acetyltransferase [Gemmatimonadetes bacterium]|nr:GNAT family N-acetyltransferase [Gemmatimonadota bacterium]